MFGISVSIFKFGLPSTLFIVFKVVLCYLVGRKKKIILLWIVIFIYMGLNNLKMFEHFSADYLKLSDMNIYYFYVSLGWNSLKCISYVMDEIQDQDNKICFSFTDYMGYIFYTPTLFIGPFVSYKRHRQMLLNYGLVSGISLFSRIGKLLRTLLYLLAIFLLTQYTLHYFYVNSFHFYYDQVRNGQISRFSFLINFFFILF